MEVIVRVAGPDDAEGIRSIYDYYTKHSVMTFAKTPGPSVEYFREQIKHIVESDLVYLVAEEMEGECSNAKKAIVGYCYVGQYRPRAAYYTTGEMSIFVRNDKQGRGVGTMLINELVSILRAPGRKREVHQLLLVMAVDEKDRGRRTESFYLRYGFEKVGHLKKVGFKFDKWVDSKLIDS